MNASPAAGTGHSQLVVEPTYTAQAATQAERPRRGHYTGPRCGGREPRETERDRERSSSSSHAIKGAGN
jgi:hypothetical protein